MQGYRERIVQFGRSNHLNGVATLPSGTLGIRSCLIMINSGIVHRVGASRVYVELARALGDRGVASLRFDLSGIGESDVPAGPEGIQEIVDGDIDDAMSFVNEQFDKVPKLGLGLCSGAYDLMRAIRRKSPLSGVILIDLFGEYVTREHVMRHYAGRLSRVESWKKAIVHPIAAVSKLGQRFAATRSGASELESDAAIGIRPVVPRGLLEELLDQAIAEGPELLFVFTGGLEEYYNYPNQFADAFPKRVQSPRISWEYLPEANHMFSYEVARQHLEGAVSAWLVPKGFAAPNGEDSG